MKDQTVTEKQTAVFECELNKPNVKVQWKKNKKPLKSSKRIQMSCDKCIQKLTIMETTLDDEDEYTCQLPTEKEVVAKLKVIGKMGFQNIFIFKYQMFQNF